MYGLYGMAKWRKKDNATFSATVTQGCIQMGVVLGKIKHTLMCIQLIYFSQDFMFVMIQNKYDKHGNYIEN